MAADRPYGESYDFYSVSPEYFGYTLVSRHSLPYWAGLTRVLEISHTELRNVYLTGCGDEQSTSCSSVN
jgi:hypothetical protein